MMPPFVMLPGKNAYVFAVEARVTFSKLLVAYRFNDEAR
jgi:hypothetical protein